MLSKIADCGTDDYLNCFKGFKTLLRQGGVFALLTSLSGRMYRWCLLPSTVFRLLASEPDQFRMRLGAHIPSLRMFWTIFLSSRQGMEYRSLHPWLRNLSVADLETMCPIRMHEDQGPFTKSKGVNCISWSSLVGCGTELETKYYDHRSCRY